MGWNGSDVARGVTTVSTQKAKPQSRSAYRLWPVFVCFAVIIMGLVAYFLLNRASDLPLTEEVKSHTSKTPANVTQKSIDTQDVKEKRHMRERIEEVVSSKVKEYITKPATNNEHWLNKPLAPDDPDRAFLNRISAQLGTLLASEPGDVMIPWPYDFLDEDAARERGEKVEGDGGTQEFLDSLKKFRIAVKEGDSEERIAFKEKMVSAQAELLEGIGEGMSVNDAIRAAYEFRKQAYELRTTAIKTMCEFLADGDTVENTREVLREMNEQLKSKGIMTISEGEIGIETEEEPENQETEVSE